MRALRLKIKRNLHLATSQQKLSLPLKQKPLKLKRLKLKLLKLKLLKLKDQALNPLRLNLKKLQQLNKQQVLNQRQHLTQLKPFGLKPVQPLQHKLNPLQQLKQPL